MSSRCFLRHHLRPRRSSAPATHYTLLLVQLRWQWNSRILLLLFLFFSSMMCMRWNLAESSCFVQNTWRNTIYWLDYGRNVSLGWHNMAPPRTVQRYSLCSYVHKGRIEEDGATQLGIWNKKVRKVAITIIIPIVMICSNRFLCSGGGLSSPQKDRTYNKYGEN